jgi:hypothetical protein
LAPPISNRCAAAPPTPQVKRESLLRRRVCVRERGDDGRHQLPLPPLAGDGAGVAAAPLLSPPSRCR